MSDEIKIDKDIPVPVRFSLPLDKMKVGDSILVNSPTSGEVCAKLSYFKKLNPHIRLVTKKSEGGVRVWRTK